MKSINSSWILVFVFSLEPLPFHSSREPRAARCTPFCRALLWYKKKGGGGYHVESKSCSFSWLPTLVREIASPIRMRSFLCAKQNIISGCGLCGFVFLCERMHAESPACGSTDLIIEPAGGYVGDWQVSFFYNFYLRRIFEKCFVGEF